MKLYIKYMVSQRCKMMVRNEFDRLGLRYSLIELGFVELPDDITQQQHDELKKNLQQSGLEVLDDKRSILIEKIKNVITEMIHHTVALPSCVFVVSICVVVKFVYVLITSQRCARI